MPRRHWSWSILYALLLLPGLYLGSAYALVFSVGAGWTPSPSVLSVIDWVYWPIESGTNSGQLPVWYQDSISMFHHAGETWARP